MHIYSLNTLSYYFKLKDIAYLQVSAMRALLFFIRFDIFVYIKHLHKMNIHAYVHNDACYVTCLHLKGHKC